MKPSTPPVSEPRRFRLDLTVQRASRSSPQPSERQIRQWLRHALRRSAVITVRLVDRPEGRSLNQTFRYKDYPTNVLTFTYPDENPRAPTRLHGDLVLCAPVVRAEARQHHKPLLNHYAHLLIHGVLHLQGYDHENEVEANLMETLEIDLLTRLSIPNPYLDRPAHG
ncbi:MAG: rRNA maturation RNase YbeY [Ferrovum sp.]|jgi:probable rRNA maturation factor|nr:rRNA maturation RNase YbeY [Ferrovum sp.]NDU88351.1 rRNA maturation RNase YbeY [Ferrovum sp.]